MKFFRDLFEAFSITSEIEKLLKNKVEFTILHGETEITYEQFGNRKWKTRGKNPAQGRLRGDNIARTANEQFQHLVSLGIIKDNDKLIKVDNKAVNV